MHAEILERGTRRLLLRAPKDDPRIAQMERQGAMVWWVQDENDRAVLGGLNWRFHEHRDGETALFEACGFRVIVQDQDGDGSVWSVQRRDPDGRFSIICQGAEEGGDPYHMDAAMVAAERAIREQVARRKQIIRYMRTGAPLSPAGLDIYGWDR